MRAQKRVRTGELGVAVPWHPPDIGGDAPRTRRTGMPPLSFRVGTDSAESKIRLAEAGRGPRLSRSLAAAMVRPCYRRVLARTVIVNQKRRRLWNSSDYSTDMTCSYGALILGKLLIRPPMIMCRALTVAHSFIFIYSQSGVADSCLRKKAKAPKSIE